ncbi:M20 Peptidase [Proteiniphilum saccharofermentans]|uniref:M20 Peptidase n=2 Tax=Proteiniphilum saccharofermentans TaxID=1642647 RepID=A0A1R3TCZ6_9BACT|nr:M20 Peptidase [Proteiniphilum saccharofermentans]
MTLKDEIKAIASGIREDILAKRRYLHQHPELSFKEFNTSAFIKKSLDEWGIPWIPVADTGIIATLGGNHKTANTIALRADMDALPIHENTGLAFKSVNPGVMHACGHDLHIASLLGAAHILKRLGKEINGTVKLIFQPAEEILPGGAIKILQEGVLQNPKVNAILGQHTMPSIESGKVGIRKGMFMASMDEIRIKVKGKGGHGAEPHNNNDPVVAAATMIVTLQQIVSRYNNPKTPTVLSFGKIEANGSTNIIPDTVYIEGTFRTMDEHWRDEAHEKITRATKSIAHGLGCECDIDIQKGYPSLYNCEVLTDKIHSYMREYMGDESIIETDIWMASEDFAYYAQNFSSCFYLLGTGYPNRINSSLHTPAMEINEECIETGMGLMSYLAVKKLED